MRDILLVSEDSNAAAIMTSLLKSEGYKLNVVMSISEAWEALGRDRFRLMFMDITSAHKVAMAFVMSAHERYSDLQMIVSVLPGNGAADDPVFALSWLAAVEKPFKVDDLMRLVQDCYEYSELDSGDKLVDLLPHFSAVSGGGSLVAQSEAMQQVAVAVERIACTNIPVLIHGERGTEKGLVARAIHLRSPRAARKFMCYSCQGGAPDAIHEDLFGSSGLLRKVKGGTLFVDAVDQLDSQSQEALLDTFAAGSTAGRIDTSVRLIAGTHHSPRALGKLNLNTRLYARLTGVAIEVKPLRERQADIIPLAEQLLREDTGHDRTVIATDAADALTCYPWPGNASELAQAMREACERMRKEEPQTLTLAMLPGKVQRSH